MNPRGKEELPKSPRLPKVTSESQIARDRSVIPPQPAQTRHGPGTPMNLRTTF